MLCISWLATGISYNQVFQKCIHLNQFQFQCNFKYITITIQPPVVKVTSCKYFGIVSTLQFPSINFWFLVNSLQFHTISIIISGCYFILLRIESNFHLLSYHLQIFSLKLTLSRDNGTLPESIQIKLIHIGTCQWNGCSRYYCLLRHDYLQPHGVLLCSSGLKPDSEIQGIKRRAVAATIEFVCNVFHELWKRRKGGDCDFICCCITLEHQSIPKHKGKSSSLEIYMFWISCMKL
jgi:hypothetical protein